MELDLNMVIDKIKNSNFIENFIRELSDALQNKDKSFNKENTLQHVPSKEWEITNMDNIELTDKEEIEFNKREFRFLQNYFKKIDLSKGELYIVTNKYENDREYHRYKVAQYTDNLERKFIAFEKDLPQNVQLRDVVRKIDGKYIYDEHETQYVKDSIDKIRQDIIQNRK